MTYKENDDLKGTIASNSNTPNSATTVPHFEIFKDFELPIDPDVCLKLLMRMYIGWDFSFYSDLFPQNRDAMFRAYSSIRELLKACGATYSPLNEEKHKKTALTLRKSTL